jgi:hypothetical protein
MEGSCRARLSRSATLALLVVSVLALAACGGSDATPTTSPAAMSGATTSSASAPTAAHEFRGMLPIVWTQSLIKQRPYRSTKTVGDVVRMRHALWTYRAESSDPRLSGRIDVVINGDQRQSDMSARLWGTSRLSNSGGTWVQRWTGGIAAGGDVHHVYGTFKGSGGYAGLVAHESGWFAEAGEGFTPDIQTVGAGWIETSDGSPVPAASGPGTTPPSWTPVVGVATLRDNSDWTFDLTMSDPRLSGTQVGSPEEIGTSRSDGSIDFRAASTLTNQDGAWTSPAGTVDVRGPAPRSEHFMYWTSTGSRAYAGLTYHGFWHFMEPQPLEVGDTFVWTGFVEEAQ